jgi:hypothetical protein
MEEAGDAEERGPCARGNAPVESDQDARSKNRNRNDQLRKWDVDGSHMRRNTACHCHQKEEWRNQAKPADTGGNAKSDEERQMVWPNDRVPDAG